MACTRDSIMPFESQFEASAMYDVFLEIPTSTEFVNAHVSVID
jgi:hypothetical protein